MLWPEGKLCPPRRLQRPSQKALADSPALLILESLVTTLSGNDSLNVFLVAKKLCVRTLSRRVFLTRGYVTHGNYFWKKHVPFFSLVKGIKMSRKTECQEERYFSAESSVR